MGSPSINIPPQQRYGEAMAESLEAQVDLLRGTNEFEGTGGLQNIVEQYETPLRKATAQIDTDVLSQTLLGSDAPDYEAYVRDNPEVMERYRLHQQNRGDTRTIEQFGRDHFRLVGRQEGRELPTREGAGMLDLLGDRRTLEGEGRRAGFDEDDEFLGISALLEDIGSSQQTRARERDLADVERLAGRYKDVMDQFRDPDAPKTVGEIGGSQDAFLQGLRERRGGEEMSMATETTAPMPGQQGLRELLTQEAVSGLGEGRTDRERRNIEQASRARATTLGRTFDVGSVEDEITAKLLEDRNRLNQNRAFAQSVLGQEGAMRMQELALQRQNELDPFRAILGRSGGSSVGQAQGVLGQAGYGLQSGPQYLNPQAGINYISQAYANQAGLEGARMGASATRQAGIFQGIGSALGGFLGR